ncbi:hypothetical protein PSHT_13641, partial [Puccinia striiformis]
SKPRTVFAITIKKDYFEDNHTAPSNVTELLNHSTLTGLKHNTKSKTAMDILAQQESSSHPENHS